MNVSSGPYPKWLRTIIRQFNLPDGIKPRKGDTE